MKPEDYKRSIRIVNKSENRNYYIVPVDITVCSKCGSHEHEYDKCENFKTITLYLRPFKDQRIIIDNNNSYLPNNLRPVTSTNTQQSNNYNGTNKNVNRSLSHQPNNNNRSRSNGTRMTNNRKNNRSQDPSYQNNPLSQKGRSKSRKPLPQSSDLNN